MPIPLTGPINLRGATEGIATEFGGTQPDSISEYYRGGAYVQATASNAIAQSGAQKWSNYRGATTLLPQAPVWNGPDIPDFAQLFSDQWNVDAAAGFSPGAPAPTYSLNWVSGKPMIHSISIDPNTGLITGSSSMATVAVLSVTATNSQGSATSNQFTATLGTAPRWPRTQADVLLTEAQAMASIDFSNSFMGSAPMTYAVVGTLPAGLTFDTATGVLSGTPTVVGTQTVQIEASNSYGTAQSNSFDIVVSMYTAPPAWSLTALPSGLENDPYSFDLNTLVTGAPAPTIAIDAGTLPAGLTLTNGVISGTPTAAATAQVSFSATNSAGTVSTGQLPLVITAATAPPTGWATIPAINGLVGSPLTVDLMQYVQGGPVPAPTITVASGTLPAGLSINAAGVLTGTPSAAGVANLTFTATNSVGTATSGPVRIDISSAAQWNPIPQQDAVVGTPFTLDLKPFTTGTPAPTITAVGALPAGYTLTNGVLTGTPAATGTLTFDLRADNGTGTPADTTVTVVVGEAPAASGTIPAQTVMEGDPITTIDLSQFFTGTPAPTYQITSAAVPGQNLQIVGNQLTGNFGAGAGGSTHTVTITATNPHGTATQPVDFTVTLPCVVPTRSGFGTPTLSSAWSSGRGRTFDLNRILRAGYTTPVLWSLRRAYRGDGVVEVRPDGTFYAKVPNDSGSDLTQTINAHVQNACGGTDISFKFTVRDGLLAPSWSRQMPGRTSSSPVAVDVPPATGSSRQVPIVLDLRVHVDAVPEATITAVRIRTQTGGTPRSVTIGNYDPATGTLHLTGINSNDTTVFRVYQIELEATNSAGTATQTLWIDLNRPYVPPPVQQPPTVPPPTLPPGVDGFEGSIRWGLSPEDGSWIFGGGVTSTTSGFSTFSPSYGSPSALENSAGWGFRALGLIQDDATGDAWWVLVFNDDSNPGVDFKIQLEFGGSWVTLTGSSADRDLTSIVNGVNRRQLQWHKSSTLDFSSFVGQSVSVIVS